jgi:apolipoprotein N-acyltransferase
MTAPTTSKTIDTPLAAVAPAVPATRVTKATIVRIIAGVALAVGSGVLAAACAGPQRVPLIWIAFAPAIVAQHRILPRRLSALGLAIAVAVYLQGYLGPLVASVNREGSLPLYYRYVAVFFGLLVLALGWRSRDFHERTGYRWFVLATPLTWAAIDFVRTLLPVQAGASGAFVANALYDHPLLIQPISIFTMHALNLLVLVTNWTAALGVIALIDRRWTVAPVMVLRRRAILALTAVAVVLTGWVGLSAAMLRNPKPAVRVAAVQSVGRSPATIAQNIAMTKQAAADGAQLVVWHEAGWGSDPRPSGGGVLAQVARENHVYLVVGWYTEPASNRGYNEATVFAPDGHIIGTYGKMHPVTILGERSDENGMFPRMVTPFGRLGAIICADLDYTDSAQHWGSLGTGILAVPSNDVGVKDHYTRIALRAVENRMSIVKADGGNDSAIVDPYGRIVKSIVLQHKGTALLVGDVAVGSGRTFVSRVGDWFGWVLLAGVAAMLVVGFVGRRHSRKV